MESSKETGCQAPEGPILCINNCGFFGSATTMNMCSKCHKDVMLKQQMENIVNATSSNCDKVPVAIFTEETVSVSESPQPSVDFVSEIKPKDGPNSCTSCQKRVGLTGFNCRCGNVFCSIHRYSDKHDCPFDYRTAARDAIAKANPLVKAKKLGKI